jgi:hypothetical protein
MTKTVYGDDAYHHKLSKQLSKKISLGQALEPFESFTEYSSKVRVYGLYL